MRRLPGLVPPKVSSRVRDLIEILFMLPLQNGERIVARSRVDQNAVIAFPKSIMYGRMLRTGPILALSALL